MKIENGKRGFTLLEMLLVIAIIAILAGIVIVAINPAKQLADANNAQRSSDVLAILNAVHQYSIDNSGDITALGIGEDSSCDLADDSSTLDDVADLDGTDELVDALTTDALYLSEIPTDPLADSDDFTIYNSGYQIYVDSTTQRITVCAPLTQDETGAVVSDSVDNIIKVTR